MNLITTDLFSFFSKVGEYIYWCSQAWGPGEGDMLKKGVGGLKRERVWVGEIKPRGKCSSTGVQFFQYIFALLTKQYFWVWYVQGMDARVIAGQLCCEDLK